MFRRTHHERLVRYRRWFSLSNVLLGRHEKHPSCERTLRFIRVSHLRLALLALRGAVLVEMESPEETKLRDDGILRSLRGHVRADEHRGDIQNALGSFRVRSFVFLLYYN